MYNIIIVSGREELGNIHFFSIHTKNKQQYTNAIHAVQFTAIMPIKPTS